MSMSTRTTPSSCEPAAAPGHGARRHIAPLDGLRGLAVLGVLFFHAGRFSGGFLGVDLFFVLSGYLITGLLLAETARTGRVDLVAFWGRRARRLLPALAVTVAGTLLLVWAFGSAALLRLGLDDAPWVIGNVANWHFIADQVGYWDSADTRVFSHLWSVAVEEQFYLVWPLVLGLLVRGRARGRAGGAHGRARGSGRVAVVAAAGAAASLALMIVLVDPVDTTRVYEGTDTRAFSLLLGALMATAPAARLLARAGRRAANRCALVLACGIGAYWALADGQSSPSLFQGGLFLHALAAALLIGCLAQAPDGLVGRLVGSAVPRWFGRVSYSLYLWHWPLYVLLSEERTGLTGWARTAVVVAASVAAAAASTYLVENPVRFRARWAHGRTGALALVATFAALAALWAVIPVPTAGTDSVDVTRLGTGG
ncbi:acyltransferase family protein [Streptomyces sp. NPDC087300]|uniref:acyltransferase family protein n=1 Tax=Streptomyces sp. NPDC087300 TaxID=3365780 RepID=UPI00380A761D